jgi:hypothetical protein
MSLKVRPYLVVAFGGFLMSCGSGGGGRPIQGPGEGQGEGGWHAATGGESGHPGAGSSGSAGASVGGGAGSEGPGGGAGSTAAGSGGGGGGLVSASGGSAGSTAASGGAGGNAGTGTSHSGGAGGHATGGLAGTPGGAGGAAGTGTGGGAGHPSVDAGASIPDGAVTDGPALAACATSTEGALLLSTIDFDGDGVADCLLTSGGTMSGWLNLIFHKGLGGGAFSGIAVKAANALQATSNIISTKDLDGDGINDIVAEYDADGLDFVYLRGQPDGLFGQPLFGPTILAYAATFGSSTGDFNNDGHVDILLATTTVSLSRDIHWVVLSGSGSALPNRVFTTLGITDTDSGLGVGANGSVGSVEVGDINNDHNLDVIGIETYRSLDLTTTYTRMIVGLGNGKGSFTSSAEIAGTDGVTIFSLTDVNTDGNLDLQVYIGNAGVPTTFYGDGTGAFSTTPP